MQECLRIYLSCWMRYATDHFNLNPASNKAVWIISKQSKTLTNFRFSLFLLVAFYASDLGAQSSLFYSPADQFLNGNAASAQSPWSFFSNPAGTAKIEFPNIGVGYQNDFQLRELSSRSAFFNYPSSLANVSVGIIQSGYNHFNIQQYGLAVSRAMAPWLNLGVRAGYLVRHQTGTGNRRLIVMDAGLQVFPIDKVCFGFYATNPAQVEWDLPEGKEYYPSILATSMAYTPVSKLHLELGVLKEMEQSPHLSFFMETPLHKQVIFRGGASSRPLRLSFGTGISWQMMTFDIGLNHHSSLGLSSSFGLLYSIRSGKPEQKPASP